MDATLSLPITPSGFRVALDVGPYRFREIGLALTLRLVPPPWRKPRDVEHAEQQARVDRLDGRGPGTEPPDSGRLLGLSVLTKKDVRPCAVKQ
jgi:hypothetical protein